jgi:serine/threonine protein kinase
MPTQYLPLVMCSHGVCHRDLKPENIMLDGGHRPVLCDFNLASPVQAPSGGGGARLLTTDVGTEGKGRVGSACMERQAAACSSTSARTTSGQGHGDAAQELL